MKPNEFKFEDKVLAVRAINSDGTSYNGFQNPTEVGEIVRPEKWVNNNRCGNGIHCWPWGISRDGKAPAGNYIWQVVEITGESVMIDGKCKCSEVKIVYSGNEAECMRITSAGRIAYSQNQSSASNTSNRSSASNTGYFSLASSNGYKTSASNTGDKSSASSTGDKSSASSTGYRSCASSTGPESSTSNTGRFSSASNTGNYSSASNTGDKSSASNTGVESSASNTGDYSSASNTGHFSLASSTGYKSSASNTGGYSSASSTGDSSVAVAIGLKSKARAGKGGVIVLSWGKEGEILLETFKVDGVKVKENTWYTLDNSGNLIEG